MSRAVLLFPILALACSTASQADVSISNKPTQNMSCEAGVCTATAQKAVLDVTDLANMLSSGDVAVKTGTVAKDIAIDQPLTWTATSRLTLDAQRSVIVKKQVTVAGQGALTVTTNDGGSGGELLFKNKGSVTFWDTSSSLAINGQSYMLVQDIATLAANIAANPSGAFALANSYDAKHDRFDTVPIATDFGGRLEGLGHTISHLKITQDSHKSEGFFASVANQGVIRDLLFTKAEIFSRSLENFVGIVVGKNSGSIINVVAAGTVSGRAGASGGLVGQNAGMILAARADVSVSGASGAGGLAGLSDLGSITASYATGDVSGGVAGGLVGNGSNIVRCYATGNVNGLGASGGLAAGGSHIDQSFATGAVVSADESAPVGGLVGSGTLVTNSYATGPVTGARKALAGGLAGFGSVISTSYSTGSVIAGNGALIGGFIGQVRRHKVVQDYWDTDTSGIAVGCGKGDCSGVVGLRTQQLQAGLPAGFAPNIWAQSPNINQGYPYLIANPPP